MITFFKNIINAIRRLFGWKNKESEVPQGLQVWDESGNIVLDTNSRTVKILGRFTYSPEIQTVVSDLFLSLTPFYIITPQFRYNDVDLVVTFQGSTCTIKNTKEFFPKTIYVGVY